MGDGLRLAVGVTGNASSMLLYAAPILTFSRVIRKRSTEEFSCIPYIVALSNCLIYTWYGSPVIKAGVIATVVIVLCSTTAIISAYVFHGHHRRKVFVGTVGLVASVAMYAAPLVVVRQVIMTKSVEFMPFYLSFFSFLASVLWLAYGLLSHDLILAGNWNSGRSKQMGFRTELPGEIETDRRNQWEELKSKALRDNQKSEYPISPAEDDIFS
ncbi:hypothetical protein V6N13_032465 [Hibiscus sabdariffa]|uniref:Bidirectional sugar transporter SWEET n=1 Tax=Hibiscus sabdariffa TaxID=183260 RepID=A0ABR2C3C3_9ROSI